MTASRSLTRAVSTIAVSGVLLAGVAGQGSAAAPAPQAPATPVVAQAASAAAVVTGATSLAAAPVRKKKVVYLTFDDGPSRYTPQVLRVLKRHNAKATFFMIGRQAKSNRSAVRQVRRGGHKIGNHTYNHPWLTKTSASRVRSELRLADAATGRTTCMRPPGGFVNSRVRSVARAERKSIVMWSVDTNDWRRPGSGRIVRSIGSSPRSGSIILMHDGGGNRSQTVAALNTVLPRLKAKGYRFATLPQCR